MLTQVNLNEAVSVAVTPSVSSGVRCRVSREEGESLPTINPPGTFRPGQRVAHKMIGGYFRVVEVIYDPESDLDTVKVMGPSDRLEFWTDPTNLLLVG